MKPPAPPAPDVEPSTVEADGILESGDTCVDKPPPPDEAARAPAARVAAAAVPAPAPYRIVIELDELDELDVKVLQEDGSAVLSAPDASDDEHASATRLQALARGKQSRKSVGIDHAFDGEREL